MPIGTVSETFSSLEWGNNFPALPLPWLNLVTNWSIPWMTLNLVLYLEAFLADKMVTVLIFWDQNKTILYVYFFLYQVHGTDLWRSYSLNPTPTQFQRLTLVTKLLWMGFFRYLIKKLCRKLEERKKAICGSSTTVINRKLDISAEHKFNGLWVWYSSTQGNFLKWKNNQRGTI